MDSIQFRKKELLIYHFGCYSNLVTIATKYVADAYHPKKLHTKYDLNRTQDKRVTYTTLWLPCNQVTIAMKYVTNVYCPKEALYQAWTQYGLKQMNY